VVVILGHTVKEAISNSIASPAEIEMVELTVPVPVPAPSLNANLEAEVLSVVNVSGKSSVSIENLVMPHHDGRPRRVS
jgi:hypothetical protein